MVWVNVVSINPSKWTIGCCKVPPRHFSWRSINTYEKVMHGTTCVAWAAAWAGGHILSIVWCGIKGGRCMSCVSCVPQLLYIEPMHIMAPYDQ